jgi:threonine dehydratase
LSDLSSLPDRAHLEAAADLVYRVLPPTPQYRWPLLCERTGCDVWVKHENHTPIGAFKVRGGLTYMDALRRDEPGVKGVVTATRGNHGQSVAFACSALGLAATVVVPLGNSREKNRAMKAWGADLIEHGRDFNEADTLASELAEETGYHRIYSYHPWLVRGVATGSMEFLSSLPDLDTVYVPIGLGSGICAMIAARNALNHRARIVGVVAANAPTYSLSFDAGEGVATDSANTIADGVAVRTPSEESLAIIKDQVERIVRVSEDDIYAGMRHYYTDTHNVAEGAGAIGLAALLAERDVMRGRKVGLVLSGGNVDREIFQRALHGGADGADV